ncbi:MAG: DNA cytosine methyltransferase [Desulfovibrio sp.]
MRSLIDLAGPTGPLREIIIDSFAGAGGASMGIRMALGRDPDVCVNHDPVAVAIHTANHPGSIHHCKSVWEVTPQELGMGLPVGLLHASPDCKHFSKAKGGKPLSQNIRDLAWVIVRYAEALFPRVIIMENVEEFQDWGPLDPATGRPIPQRKGETFREWLAALKRLRYRVEWRELRACDYGAPTIRKRLFILARRDGLPIVWPKPTHGNPKSKAVKSGKLARWRTAAECINWSDPAPSIFERARPLAENTLRRVAKGIERYVVDAEKPFLVKACHAYHHFRGQALDEPLRSISTQPGFALACPHLTTYYGIKGGADLRAHPVDDPLRTASTENRFGLVFPCLVTNTSGHAAQDIADPAPTLTTGGQQMLCAPYLTEHANSSTQRVFPADEPLRTQVAQVKRGHFSLACPVLIGAGGPTYSGEPARAEAPLGTIVAKNTRAVCTAHIVKNYTGVVGSAADAPLGTFTAVDHNSLCVCHVQRMHGRSVGQGVETPLGTVCGHSKDQICAASMVKMRGNAANLAPGSPADSPLDTVSAGGLHHGVSCAHLLKYYGTACGHAMGDPAHTVTSKHRLGLVESRTGGGHAAEVRALLLRFRAEERARREAKAVRMDWLDELLLDTFAGEVVIEGQVYVIDDIGLRMLRPRELARAQGFPDEYILDPIKPNGKRVTATEQVRGIGNSVCPPLEAALVRANVPELAVEKAEVAA